MSGAVVCDGRPKEDAMAPPTRANWLSIAALGLIWGGTFMVVTVALAGYGPVTVAAARTTLGALALLFLAILLGRRFPGRDWPGWGHVVALSVLSSALPFFLLSWGQQHVPSAFAGLSMSALPLFVLPLAHFFSDEPLTRRKLAGFGIGFLGAMVLLGPGAVDGFRGGITGLGQLACLGAVLSYAVASILTRRCPAVDPVALSALALTGGTAILLPAMLLTEGLPGWAGPEAGLALLFLGLVPTGLAALLRVLVIRSAGSGFMTLVNYQVPLWAMLFGWAVLDERLPARFFVALGLILAGIAVSQKLRITRPRSA
jgi:drug/metabolite transporter (DMT)-like permease